jgi:putative toxin-antitoxin system antitoxin component (TIGR02293 family)
MLETVEQVLGVASGTASSIELAHAIEKGLPQSAFDRVKALMGLTDEQIAASLRISQRTATRLRKTGLPLSPEVSDQLYRIARLFTFTREVLGSDEAAREWLRTPQPGLNNETPLELVTTEVGAREVEDLLGRIEYGVLS